MKPDTLGIAELVEKFRKYYSTEPRIFYAPGRINLIGEHTDYNDGFVLPMAIDYGTAVLASCRTDRTISVFSEQLNGNHTVDLNAPEQKRRGYWIDYVEGVARALIRREVPLPGAHLLISSNVTMGAGLASSAALEVALAFALSQLSNIHDDPLKWVFAAQEAEHDYVGTESGIMDQFIAVFGKAGACLLLDCRSLEFSSIPVPVDDVAWIVCDTRVKHRLAFSEYNRRRLECRDGIRQIAQFLPGKTSLREVAKTEYQHIEMKITDRERRRCRHVISENERTLASAAALREGRLSDVGNLMFESHRSLRFDYEVSCRELDILVDCAAKIDGVLGARMTGGGFGGCTINLVRRPAAAAFAEGISADYCSRIGERPAVFEVRPSDGVHEIRI